MANVPLKSIKFPDLSDTYTIPQIDSTLAVAGKAADAKATGDAIAAVSTDVAGVKNTINDGTVIDLTTYGYHEETTSDGVKYTYLGGNAWKVNGTLDGTSFYAVFNTAAGAGVAPFVGGRKYYIWFTSTDSNIKLQLYKWVGGSLTNAWDFAGNTNDFRVATFPSDATGYQLRFKTNASVSNAMVTLWVYEEDAIVAASNKACMTAMDLNTCEDGLRDLAGLFASPWEHGGLYAATGIEYDSATAIRTPFKAVGTAKKIVITNKATSGNTAAVYEFASNQTTASGTNERLAVSYINANSTTTVTLNASTKYIRLQLPSSVIADGEKLLAYTYDSIIGKPLAENAYLAPTGDTTDRTTEIVAMLTAYGICRLGKGDYYVSNLDMPGHTSIVGVGNKTRIILAGSSDGYAIKMTDYCNVSDCLIMGGTSSITLSSTVGGRHGILWQGNYTETETSSSQPINGMISNVRFYYFTGGGITCDDTGYGTANSLEVTNVFCTNCNAGINVAYFSEYHKFTNVRTAYCYYGCINNGGNNIFVNCDFSSCKVGFLMDNSSSQSPNNSHGTCVGCLFNHTDSNAGIGIKVLNCDNGFVFDGCQIYFSQIDIEDSDGVVVSNSNFGDTNCDITVKNGGVALFANNLYGAAPTITITNNQNVHFVNCYVKSTGAAVTPA